MKIALIEKFLTPTPDLNVGDFTNTAQTSIVEPAMMPIAGTQQAFANVSETLYKNRQQVVDEIARLSALRDELTVALDAIEAGRSVIKQHKDAQQSLDNGALADLLAEAAKVE